MAETAGNDGDDPMIIPNRSVPEDILENSVLAHIAAAYFSVGKRLERKTQCSATRGFIMSSLREGAELNQNQVATLLGLDRTVVHRAIKSMIQEGLAAEKKASSGRAILVRLTAKGNRYREGLIRQRIAADQKIREAMTPDDRRVLIRLLQQVAEVDF